MLTERFKDRVVLITGAAAGIGRATAERLAAEGARVCCTDINQEGVDATASLLTERGGQAIAHTLDIADEDQANSAVAACVDHFGQLDVLCNIAGVVRMDETLELSSEDWRRVIDINLTGTMFMCRAAIPHLLSTHGNIVNTASISALAGMPWGAAYAASKGGVLALTYALAIEYGKRGLRVNAVCPGSVDTDMNSGDIIPEGVDVKLLPRIMPLDRSRGPETVASVIAMLASDDGAHINGERIRIDGATLS